jgi:GTP-binding protein
MIKVESAKFISSKVELKDLPNTQLPEFAFIGRSNVGKSSLINYLTNQNKLAKTSSTPGKTQTINHYLINENFYFVDLPGYGYANVPLSVKKNFEKMIQNYLLHRETLYCLFLLIDIRHEPLKIDLDFIQWIGENQIPFCIIFTKSDKLSTSQIEKKIEIYKNQLLKTWEELPPIIITSAEKKIGGNEILSFIDQILQ